MSKRSLMTQSITGDRSLVTALLTLGDTKHSVTLTCTRRPYYVLDHYQLIEILPLMVYAIKT